MLSIVGIIIGILFLIWGSYRRFGVLPLSLISSVIIAVFSGINLWEALGHTYMGGFAQAFQNYFLIFSFSCLYSKLMERTGSATKIGYVILNLVGKKNVMTACCIISGILCYGGINGFIITFILAPIMYTLFSEADIPRHLCIGPVMFGCATWVMGCMPGSTQLNNVIPTQFFGTKLTSGPVMGLTCSAMLIVLHLIYLNRQVRIARAKNEHFTFPRNVRAEDYRDVDSKTLPAAWKSFAPVLFLIGTVVIGSMFSIDTTLLTVASVFLGCVICFLLNLDRLKKIDNKTLITEGLNNGFTAISSLASILGMGAVVTSTTGYKTILDAVLNLQMSPYIKAAVSTAIIACVVGTASGGLRITCSSLADYFLAQNINPVYLHRVMSLASLTIDTLPQAAGPFIHLGILDLTHKECYRHIFRISVVHTSLVTAILLFVVTVILR